MDARQGKAVRLKDCRVLIVRSITVQPSPAQRFSAANSSRSECRQKIFFRLSHVHIRASERDR
jgi:hypothetical protein